jgi:ABC-type antimicrobial peptide transport system permease subunit
MALPLTYSMRNSIKRKLTFFLTVFGVALVVFVFSGVLMLSNGLVKTLVDTGSDDNVVVVRKAATTEIVSIIPRDMSDVVKADPAIAQANDGRPMLAGEILVLISLVKRSTNEPSNIPVRGIDSLSMALRPSFHLSAGRLPNPGTSEIIAGKAVAKNFKGSGIGETVRFGMRDWTVVGIFEMGGGGFESEIWGNVEQLMDAFDRPVYSSLTLKLRNVSEFTDLKKRIESDPRLTLDVMNEKEYYRRQSETFSSFINILGMMISIFFSVGAIIGAMITLYASVSNRTREIGTLRALGFSRGSVMLSFLVEALSISLLGGCIGLLGASLLQFVEVSTSNFDTFAELAFGFNLSADIVITTLIFALVMGFLGGFLPAMRAARFKIINALRAK